MGDFLARKELFPNEVGAAAPNYLRIPITEVRCRPWSRWPLTGSWVTTAKANY